MLNVGEIAPGIQGMDINVDVELLYDVDSDVKKDQVIILSFFNQDDASEVVIECLKNL